MSVNEIVQKEEEKHQLVQIGVITRLQDALNRMKERYPQSDQNSWDKKSILQYFYATVVSYASFITREKATNKILKKVLFRKCSDLLLSLQKDGTALLDKEMKTGSQLTVAYRISDIIYDSIYTSFCRSTLSFENPDETYLFFLQELKKRYPVNIHAYVEMLEQGDSSFWDVTCRYLQGLSNYVIRHYSGAFSANSYDDIIRDETWSKAYEVLKKRLIDKEGNIPSFQTGNDFRNYMIKTCRYLAENLYKKYAGIKEISFDELTSTVQFNDEGETAEEGNNLPFEIETASEPEYSENDVKELDIDNGNPYEVAYAVSIILLNHEHPLRPMLVQGIEDKVELLINKAVHDMSYNDIVASSHGNNLDDDVFRRTVAKARKDYERIRKELIKRLHKFVEKKGETLCHIQRHSQML